MDEFIFEISKIHFRFLQEINCSIYIGYFYDPYLSILTLFVMLFRKKRDDKNSYRISDQIRRNFFNGTVFVLSPLVL